MPSKGIVIRVTGPDADLVAKEADAMARLLASTLVLNGYDCGQPAVIDLNDPEDG